MKKNKKFITIPVLKAKNTLTIASSILLVAAVVYSMLFFVLSKPDAEFVNLMVHIGTQKAYTPPPVNIVETMLAVSAPGIVFSDIEPTAPTEPVSSATEPATELVFENTAQSITYESAEEKGYKSVDGIYINNQTSKSIDIESLLNKNIDLSLSDEPSVLIVHTHTTESYTPSEKYNYTPTESDRTTDLNFNMAAVGDVIYQKLTASGINVIHDKTINDYPSYSTSYSKSLKLVESYKAKYPSIKIVIDVHRDAIVSKNGTKMRPLTAFEQPCAQVMLVVGTNDSGLNHPDWQTNLAFSLKLQHRMNSLYPSLARPINLRRERFNHHLAPYAFILEVGTNGNTLDEAIAGASCFSDALIALLKV